MSKHKLQGGHCCDVFYHLSVRLSIYISDQSSISSHETIPEGKDGLDRCLPTCGFVSFLSFLSTRFYYVAQAILELLTFLPRPSKQLDYRPWTPNLVYSLTVALFVWLVCFLRLQGPVYPGTCCVDQAYATTPDCSLDF